MVWEEKSENSYQNCDLRSYQFSTMEKAKKKNRNMIIFYGKCCICPKSQNWFSSDVSWLITSQGAFFIYHSAWH